MLIQIGSFRIATGRHHAGEPEASIDKARSTLPPGAVPVRDLRDQVQPDRARELGTAAPAAAVGPTPGALPAAIDTTMPPRRYAFQQGINQINTPGRGKVTSFQLLRQLAKNCDIVRICIETRKDQILSQSWDIVPTDKRKEATPAELAKLKAARAFFAKPDRRRKFQTWLRLAIEEILVIDALSIHRQRTRGGELFALRVVDGSTIVPLIDENGDTPLPPRVAYRQIINGQAVEGGDCTTDQLDYCPRSVSTDTPYGMSPTEAILLTVNSMLQRRMFPLSHYAEGNVPAGFMSAPENWTTKQIAEFQTYWDDMLAGNQTMQSRIRIVGQGMAESYRETVKPDFTTAFDEFLVKLSCAAFGVTPSEIGFTADVNKATSSGQENITYRRGVKPLNGFLKEIMDPYLAEFGLEGWEWQPTGGEPEDKKQQAEVDEIYLRRGIIGADDIRGRMGLQPIGLGPMIDTPLGPISVEELLAAPPDDDPDTSEVDAPGNDAEDTDTPEQQAAREATAQRDMRLWRGLAIKALKAGQSPRPFESDAIAASVKLHVRAGLLRAASVADVVKLFADASQTPLVDGVDLGKASGREYRTFTGAPRVAMVRYRRHFAKSFRALGTSLGAHLKNGVTPGAQA